MSRFVKAMAARCGDLHRPEIKITVEPTEDDGDPPSGE